MGYELILDTSSKQLAIGIYKDDELLYKNQYYAWLRQSEMAIPEIEKAINELKIDLREVTRIVASIGPGSYTGVRIALTIAKVMALTLNIPLFTVSSLQALAGKKDKVISIMDARSKRVYIGVYDKGVEVVKDTIFTLEELKKYQEEHHDYQLIGELSALGEEDSVISLIENMHELAKDKQPVNSVHEVKPVYLKD